METGLTVSKSRGDCISCQLMSQSSLIIKYLSTIGYSRTSLLFTQNITAHVANADSKKSSINTHTRHPKAPSIRRPKQPNKVSKHPLWFICWIQLTMHCQIHKKFSHSPICQTVTLSRIMWIVFSLKHFSEMQQYQNRSTKNYLNSYHSWFTSCNARQGTLWYSANWLCHKLHPMAWVRIENRDCYDTEQN